MEFINVNLKRNYKWNAALTQLWFRNKLLNEIINNKRINYVYKFLLKFEDVNIYRIHMKCKNIWNIQTTVRVIIFNKWNKSLLRLGYF